jgi:hypothetical protein
MMGDDSMKARKMALDEIRGLGDKALLAQLRRKRMPMMPEGMPEAEGEPPTEPEAGEEDLAKLMEMYEREGC